MQAPGSVVAGTGFQVSYSYAHDKSGGVIAVIPGGPRSLFQVNHPGGLDWFLGQLGAISHVPITGRSGSATLVAPAMPGQYGIVAVYAPDGGTIDTASLMVTAATPATGPGASQAQLISARVQELQANGFDATRAQQTAQAEWDQGLLQTGTNLAFHTPAAAVTLPVITPAPAAASGPTINPWAATGGAAYTPPSPEPKASDGASLSQQGADLQAYYVANYGPGMLAATQFVIDHEHQLAAIGSSQHPTTVYAKPANEPAASNGEHLSDQTNDVQAYYVQTYGPGFLAASAFVVDRNHALGTSVPGGASVVLPAGPGAGGPDTGIGGGGAWSGSTPTVPADRQTGAPPPSVGSMVSELTSNPTLLIGAAAIGAFLIFGGKRR